MRPLILMTLFTLSAAPVFGQSTTTPNAPVPAANVQTATPPRAQPPGRLTLTEPSPAPLSQQGQQAPPGTRGQAPRFQNVRLDLTITDTYTGAPIRKTVSMLVLMGDRGMIRTSNRLPSGHEVGLNVDAAVTSVGNQMRISVTFEYTPAQLQDESTPRAPGPAQLHESLTVVIADGETLQISQSADPATDRKVTAELTATILK